MNCSRHSAAHGMTCEAAGHTPRNPGTIPTPTAVTARYDAEHTSIVWCVTFGDRNIEIWGQGMSFAQFEAMEVAR